jgi:hypothetical protein
VGEKHSTRSRSRWAPAPDAVVSQCDIMRHPLELRQSPQSGEPSSSPRQGTTVPAAPGASLFLSLSLSLSFSFSHHLSSVALSLTRARSQVRVSARQQVLCGWFPFAHAPKGPGPRLFFSPGYVIGRWEGINKAKGSVAGGGCAISGRVATRQTESQEEREDESSAVECAPSQSEAN